MTNLKSIFGASVWMAVAALLMLVTFEPVQTDVAQPQLAVFITTGANA
jgi:hypothetical protein